jgi:hypothetical protein
MKATKMLAMAGIAIVGIGTAIVAINYDTIRKKMMLYKALHGHELWEIGK